MNPVANAGDEQGDEDSEGNEGVEDQDNGSEEGDEESGEEEDEEEEDGVESVDSRAEDDDGEMAIDVPPVATHNGSSYTGTACTQSSNTDSLLFSSAGRSRLCI